MNRSLLFVSAFFMTRYFFTYKAKNIAELIFWIITSHFNLLRHKSTFSKPLWHKSDIEAQRLFHVKQNVTQKQKLKSEKQNKLSVCVKKKNNRKKKQEKSANF